MTDLYIKDLPIDRLEEEEEEDNEGNHDEGGDSEQTILEEYKLWRKNCRYMYSFISETALTWPSLSIQFIPSNTFINKTKDSKYATTRNLVLTTHTSGEDVNYLKIASMQLPKSITDNIELTEEELETVNSRLKISKKFEQDCEINRVRIMPQNGRIFGSINGTGEVFIYELDDKMNEINKVQLKHHSLNGFGLSWNRNNEGELATCGDDKTIAIWNYKESLKPTKIIRCHGDIVNDVRWHEFNSSMFGSVGEDKKFCYNDKRVDSPVIDTILNKDTTFNTLSFSRFSENLVAFGAEDSNVYLYDIRKIEKPLHIIMGHTKSITNVEWDPFHENVIGSSSLDRRVILWDINKIGEEQLPDEMEDGVPELLMMHGGHTGGVNDFQFNNEIEWCVCSCSDDNIVHVWKVDEKVVEDYNEDVDYKILE